MRAQSLRHKPLELDLPAEAKILSELRAALRHWLGEYGVPPDDVFKILVAVGEAAANVIEHAYGPKDATFKVTGMVQDNRVIMMVRDFGSWRRARESNRGRGIKLMRGLMDTVRIDRSSQGSTVRMSRRVLPGAPT